MKQAIFLSWFSCGVSDMQTIQLSYMLVFDAGDQWIQEETVWWTMPAGTDIVSSRLLRHIWIKTN